MFRSGSALYVKVVPSRSYCDEDKDEDKGLARKFGVSMARLHTKITAL